jgi:predicted nucleic acid-binding protein
MTRSILLDADILVDFLRGNVKAVAFMNNYSDRIILSSIVVAELFAGAKGSAEQVALEEFVSLFREVPVNVRSPRPGALQEQIQQNTRRRTCGCYSGSHCRGRECRAEDAEYQELPHVEATHTHL